MEKSGVQSDQLWQKMKKTELQERRKALRYQVNWEAIVKGKRHTQTDFIEVSTLVNLSSRGAFFQLNNRIEVGTKVELYIRLPNGEERWLMYTGKVIRCEAVSHQVGIAMLFQKARPWIVDNPNLILDKSDI